MADYGVTPTGFNRKRLDLLLEELNSEMKAIFGDNFNVSPESPDGQVNGIKAESDANLWELTEEAYNAFNPGAVTGVTLSNLVQLNGLTRLAATSSRAQLTITGTAGTVIPADSLISTSDTGDQFATEVGITLDGSGNGAVFASSISIGPIQALAGTLTVIDTPITGWATVTNSSNATVGTDEETDVELRARRERSVAQQAQNILDALYSAVNNLDGVSQAVVLENDTDTEDANGLPPHSFQVIVVGGDNTEIANIIWKNKPAGIKAFGTTTEAIVDSQGISHNISFSRPTEVNIFVEVTLTTDSDYPTDGDELIKEAIVDYANGRLIEGLGFTLGDNVIYTRLYTPINTVPGHEISDLQIGLVSPAVGTSNISIAATEVPVFLVGDIVVNS